MSEDQSLTLATGKDQVLAVGADFYNGALTGEAVGSLRTNGKDLGIYHGMQVRRLTPVECARLQGFPDDYLSQVTFRGKCPPADGVMYKALGNSWAVPCARWIGERIKAIRP